MKKKFRLGIKIKTIILIAVFGLSLVLVSMAYFSVVSTNNNKNDYLNLAQSTSDTVAEVVNVEDLKTVKNLVKPIVDSSEKKPLSSEWGSPEWNDYIAQFNSVMENEAYVRLRTFLQKLDNVNKDTKCLCLIYVDYTNKLVVYLVDSTRGDDFCPPGVLDPLYHDDYSIIENPEGGFPATISDTAEYSHLVTSGSTIKDGDEIVGYATVDISMLTVHQKQVDSIMSLFVYLIISVLIIIVIGIVVVNQILNKPIKKIHDLTIKFDSENIEKTHQEFVDLKINTRDEIAELAESIKKMESDINDKINALTELNEELAKSHKETEIMSELAKRDGLTGVQNKTAYNNEVKSINDAINKGTQIPFGIAMIDLNYLKETNDEFGHEAGDNALKKLAGIVCNIFKRSPVYRIGGDEFVVILRKSDYNNSAKLIKQYKEEISAIIHGEEVKEERISAALGYATFNKATDKEVEDVFKRADSDMYENKRKMKSKESSGK